MMPGVAYARTTGARPGYTHRADVMIRLPALLLAGCVVSTGLILVGRGSTSSDSPLFGRSSPTTEIKTGAQAREIAEPLLGSTQRPPEAAASDNAGDPRLPARRLAGIQVWVWLHSNPWHLYRARVQGIAHAIRRDHGASTLVPYVSPTVDWI